jgi:hypothetical protein
MFQQATTINSKTCVKQMKTNTWIKDTFQEFFTDRIFAFTGKLRGSAEDKQAALEDMVKQLFQDTKDTMSLDPHQDTPVEILHVVLLGFVKYFWRDAISHMNDAQKEILTTRLSSVNVTGLGIPPLAGKTLVKYAGSLTGRDFRAITQTAPFVLYDLVPRECYDTWLSLCALVLLIWQPMITNLDEHLVSRLV